MKETKPAQAEQANKPCINFSHRANVTRAGEFSNLHDSIEQALQRAVALSDLLEVACEVTDPASFNTDTLWRASQAIRFEIQDAQALLDAYFDSEAGKVGASA